MNPKIKEIKARNKSKRFSELIEDAEAGKITFTEAIMEIKDSFPHEVEYIEKPFKTSEKKREYLKNYRLKQKKLQKIKQIEEKTKLKIKKALKAEKFFCFKCKESIIINNPSENTYLLKKKASGKKSINIINQCPKCEFRVAKFGGLI